MRRTILTSIIIISLYFILNVAYSSVGIGVVPIKININSSGLQTISVCVFNQGNEDGYVCAEGDIPVISPSCSVGQYVLIPKNTTINNCKKVDIYANVLKSGYIYLRGKSTSNGTVGVQFSVGIYVNYTLANKTTQTTTKPPTNTINQTKPPTNTINQTKPPSNQTNITIFNQTTNITQNITNQTVETNNTSENENRETNWDIFNFVIPFVLTIAVLIPIIIFIYYVLLYI